MWNLSKKYLLINSNYNVENGRPIVYVRFRSEDLESVILKDSSLKPYFGVRRSDIENVIMNDEDGRIEKVIRSELKGSDGRKIYEVITKLPSDVRYLSKFAKHPYQNKLLFEYHYLTKKGWYQYLEGDFPNLRPIPSDPYFSIKRRQQSIDIEIDGTLDNMRDAWKNPTSAITMIGLYDNYDDVGYTWQLYPLLEDKYGIEYAEKEDIWKNPIKKKYLKSSQLKNLDNDYKDKSFFFVTEFELLEHFLSWFENNYPDDLYGWNAYGGHRKTEKVKRFRPGFDFSYMIARMKLLGLNVNRLSPFGQAYVFKNGKTVFKGINLIDAMYVYDYSLRSMQAGGIGLNATSRRELGIGKHYLEEGISKEWFTKPREARYYNWLDKMLVYWVDKKLELLKRLENQLAISGCCLDVSHNAMRMHTIGMYRDALEKGLMIKTSINRDVSDLKKEGGFVWMPTPSIYNDVFVVKLDFSKMYPSIQMSWNISPETKFMGADNFYGRLLKAIMLAGGKLCKAPNDVWFYKEPEGLASAKYKKMIALRNSYKKEYLKVLKKYKTNKHPEYRFWKEKEYNVKPPTNSLYGVYFASGFVMYDADCGNAVTAGGRELVKFTAESVKELSQMTEIKMKVLYGDTDSVFIMYKPDSEQEGYLLAHCIDRWLNKKYDEFAKRYFIDKHSFKLGIEEIEKSIIFTRKKTAKEDVGSKKTYSCHTVWKDGVFVDICPNMTGYASVKSNEPELGKMFQRKFFEMVHKKHSRIDLIRLCKRAKKLLKHSPPELIGKSIQLSKPLKDYKTKNQNAEAIKYSNTYLGTDIKKREECFLLFVKSNRGDIPTTETIALKRGMPLPEGFKIDVNKMFDKTLWSQVEMICELVDIDRIEAVGNSVIMRNAGYCI